MIKKEEIDRKATEFGISPQSVEKDYIFGWLLQGLYTQSQLASGFILKGGNALRKAYLEETRFSQDLDFSLENGIDAELLRKELENICRYVNDQTGVSFELDKITIKDKILPDELATDVLEARIHFKGFYGKESIQLRAQMDITQFDQIFLPIQHRQLIHPYSDSEECQANVQCQKAEEILASKFVCMLHRGKPADLYDLAKMLLFDNPYQVNRLEVVRTFLSKSVYQGDHATARSELLGVSLEKYRRGWGQFIVPTLASLNFDSVISGFPGLIDSLFTLVLTQTPAFQTVIAPRIRVGGFSAGYTSGYGHLSSETRNNIISAGKSRTMIELTYDGVTRMVEPYAIEYYVRKSDHRGSEYFWGYDTSGGRSGKQSIKRFFCEKIQAVYLTNIRFAPRYTIEF